MNREQYIHALEDMVADAHLQGDNHAAMCMQAVAEALKDGFEEILANHSSIIVKSIQKYTEDLYDKGCVHSKMDAEWEMRDHGHANE
jgi:hypothetical protein